jgi:Mn2+/Fe2+ NRAMP family transporter
MSNWLRTGRFRSNKKRLGRIRWSTFDKWLMVLLALVMLLSVAAGAWLAYHHSD